MRNKGTLAMLAILLTIGGVSFFVYRLTNRLRISAPVGVHNSGALPSTYAAAPGASGSLASSNAAASAGVADSGTVASNKLAPMRPTLRPAVPRMNPYAVVRDGICVPSNTPDPEKASRQKWEALLRDPFWQSIFAGVNPEEFTLVKTSLPQARHVAYWKMEKGQLIHWTGKKILIPAGTRVFTDSKGHMYLCACGNQVAAVLPATMSETVLGPEQEPPVAYLVPPEPEPFSVTSRELPGETPVAQPPELAQPPALAPPSPYDGSEPIIPIPPIFVPLGGEPGPGPPPPLPPEPPPSPEPPPPVIPEPGTLSLVLIGFGATILACRYRKQQ
jgi:hypothetical protein